MKSVICTRAAVKSTQCNDMSSPLKKEAKLDNNIHVKNDNSDEIHSITEYKSPVHIDSYFYQRVCNLF